MSEQHWSIGGGIRSAISQLVEEGAVIVELGSGYGTNKLVKKYVVWSIENDEKWVGFCKDANYIHAPITRSEDGGEQWYDASIIEARLPSSYDLILVDGPPGRFGREGLLSNFNLFRTDVPIIIDDTIRDQEAKIARELAYKLNRPLYTFWNFSIIAPDLLSKSQVATIQREAVRVLEQEERSYLEHFFSSPKPIRSPDCSEWHNRLAGYKEPSDNMGIIKSSWSWKIGRLITFPVRMILGSFKSK